MGQLKTSDTENMGIIQALIPLNFSLTLLILFIHHHYSFRLILEHPHHHYYGSSKGCNSRSDHFAGNLTTFLGN